MKNRNVEKLEAITLSTLVVGVLTNSRISLMKRHNALKNTITAVMDEYFS